MSLQSVFHMYKINPDLLSVGVLHFSYLFVEVTCAVSALASVQYEYLTLLVLVLSAR